MPHIKNRYLVLIIIGLLILFVAVSQRRSQQSIFPSASPQQNSASPASSTETSAPHCLDEQSLSQTLGQTYHLQNEQFFPEDLLLSCKYQAEQPVNNIMPTAEYSLRIQTKDAESLWQNQQTTDQKTAEYRRIEEDQALFADVNAVKELSQVTFFGWHNQNYLQLNYTPVKEEVGVELDKGKKLSEQVLSGLQ